jgi:hypothetical protein
VGGNGRNDGRSGGDDDAEQRLLETECGAGARGPGRLRGGRISETVPRHAQYAGDEEERDEERERRGDGGGDAGGEERERDADRP